ncbi:hypothetical protein [Streptomyces sp. NPDC005438]|uniref:hypothetical protein n=1 Tax=Streptomyces sp. NPDC005438 TaxID=3156880 RepID=UPI0033BBA61B
MPDADNGAFPAFCAHTHLFPGCRCRVRDLPDPQDFASDPSPVGLGLRFSDGVVAEAEILVAEAGDTVLAVPEYTTGAGTQLGERTWFVRELRPVGEEVELVLGGRSDPSGAR